MKKEINNIKLYINKDEKSLQVSKKLKKELLDNGFNVTNNNYDLVISIGGDGSFLRMIKEEGFNNQIYYVGVNAGTLGFLQEIDIKNTLDFVKRLRNNDYKIEELGIEETKIKTKNDNNIYYSLNEIVIRNNDFSLLKVPIYVDNELLEQFTGDGILISTSTGSTAYNMSFGGSIIYNTLKTLSITPIAPINNKIYHTLVNSVIIPDNKVIKVIPNTDLFLMIDGENKIVKDVLEIKTKVSKKKIKCIRMNEFHFIRTVNNKIL